MIRQLTFVMVLFVAGLAMPLAAHAESAAYFRSTGGVATADEQPLPHEFDTEESLIWKTPLPAGHSSPCVSGNAVYLTTYDADKEELATVALDRNSGKLVWKNWVRENSSEGEFGIFLELLPLSSSQLWICFGEGRVSELVPLRWDRE